MRSESNKSVENLASEMRSPENGFKTMHIVNTDVSGDLYCEKCDQITPERGCNDTEMFIDSFYDKSVNPMYSFESPYMMRNYSEHSAHDNSNSLDNDATKYSEDVRPCLSNDHEHRIDTYGHKVMRYDPSYGYDAYPISTAYGTQELNRTYHVPKISVYPPDGDLNKTRVPDNFENHETTPQSEQKEQKSDRTHSTATSVVGETSPMLQPEPSLVGSDPRLNYCGNTMYLPNSGSLPPVPLSFRGVYDAEYFHYAAPPDTEDDAYNQTYMENGREGLGKPVVRCYNTTNTQFYSSQARPTGNNVTNGQIPPRPLMVPRPYNAPQHHFLGNVMYCTNGWLPKSYSYDSSTRSNYCPIPESTGYYDSGAEFVPVKTSTEKEIGTPVSENQVDPSNKHQNGNPVTGSYDAAYEQAPLSDYFYNHQNGINSMPTQGAAPENYVDERIKGCAGHSDAMKTELCMESLKNLNRNNIDFLRMSESVWQALRTTGMFKLGNKGRAVLKSKISKQLKLNPHLRMRALCISGVRRATTRQLFQLAQICGIKSHLK
ncbi:uncharacterized protein BXIN_0116 [Babesia sp. Xinjiang]|uniref:uncharacterized protein n=1 Tax=Babesia sp. Xinjiang TaxID=462227 RepID=UPI000A24DCF8|nr:uncharacterized protein BXIN_0116 [Babesia sp. Xinjiang]ORM39680.1 hypothetical protein BXIN_0116 [Babesia sp. Xinjiang]